MDLSKNDKYWVDISMAVNALQDTKVNKKRLKTTTQLKDFAIDMTKDSL